MKTVLKALILIFIASPALATEESAPVYDPVKEIMESRNKSNGMQGARWNNSKKEKETQSEETKESEESAKPEEDSDNPLWNKYKEADANTDEKEAAPPTEESKEEGKTAEDKEKSEEKPKTGLAAILERYKNAQKNKSGMSSRSFGNLDR